VFYTSIIFDTRSAKRISKQNI